MTQPYLGEITLFAGDFAPRGWAFCDGQLLAVSQNTALFSVLGTTFGGNGNTNFALPNLSTRFAMHWGQGPGLTPRELGEAGGREEVTITTAEIPRHTHQAMCFKTADTKSPSGAIWASPSARDNVYSTGLADSVMEAGIVALVPEFGGQQHENLSPGFILNYIIATEGIFPDRT